MTLKERIEAVLLSYPLMPKDCADSLRTLAVEVGAMEERLETVAQTAEYTLFKGTTDGAVEWRDGLKRIIEVARAPEGK